MPRLLSGLLRSPRRQTTRVAAVHLVLLVGAAAVVARTVSSVVAEALPSLPTERAARRQVPVEPSTPLSASRVAATLGLSTATQPARSQTPVARADVPLSLLGTMAPTAAAIVDEVDGRVRTLEVGESTHDVALREVGHGYVVVEFREQLVRVEPGRRSAAQVASPALPPRDGAVSRAEVATALRDLPSLMQQVRMMPAFVDGVFRGFRVVQLSNALLTRAGLAQGDVLKSVNGLDLAKPENLGQLLAQAGEVRRVEVELERGGKPMRLSLSLE